MLCMQLLQTPAKHVSSAELPRLTRKIMKIINYFSDLKSLLWISRWVWFNFEYHISFITGKSRAIDHLAKHSALTKVWKWRVIGIVLGDKFYTHYKTIKYLVYGKLDNKQSNLRRNSLLDLFLALIFLIRHSFERIQSVFFALELISPILKDPSMGA